MEAKPKKDGDGPTSEEFDRFDALTRKLIAVPKEELRQQQQKSKGARAAKRKSQRKPH